MKAYSVDLRQRVLAAVDRGMARHVVVTTFGVSLATLKRWLVHRRDQADLTPHSPPGRQPTITVQQHAALWAQLEAHDDVTLATHAQLWNAAAGTSVSQWTIGRAIRRLGWTRKKRRWVPPNGTKLRASSIVSGSPTGA